MSRAGLALLVACAAACGDAQPAPDAGMGTMELEIGTVDAEQLGFFPLAGDQPLVPGAQGGFHVWVKYRVSGDEGRTVMVRRTARRVSDERLILRAEGMQDVAGGAALEELVPSFMCPSPPGVKVHDVLVRFRIEIVDPETGDLLATGAAEATPRCPAEHLSFCQRICSG